MRTAFAALCLALLAGCPASPPPAKPGLRLAFADQGEPVAKVGETRALVVTRGQPGEPAFSALLELNPAPPIVWSAAPPESARFEAAKVVFLRPGTTTLSASLDGERTNDLVVQVQ